MRRLVFLSLCVGSIIIAEACGGTTETDDGGLDSSSNDVTTTLDVNNTQDNFVPDVIETDTSTDDGGTDATSGDASDGATTPDGSKPITSWTCGNTTVSDCAQCVGHTQTCVYCSNADASALSGVCVQFGTGCGATIPQNYNLCSCPKDAAACPEPYLVCLPVNQQQSVCDTCGAVQMTNGLTCENGGKCNADSGACQ